MGIFKICRASVRIVIAMWIVAGVAPVSYGEETAAPFPRQGEWPCYRRNPSQDAHSPMKGHITNPVIAWKHFVGVTEVTLIVEPCEGKSAVTLSPGELQPLSPEASDLRWGLSPPMGLIEGREQPIVRDGFHTYADVLPDVPGLEKFEVRKEGTAACFAWRNGKWEQVWETEKMDFGNTVSANPIVGDFDGDGKPELAFLPWWNLVVVNAVTGKIKDVCRFTEGRSYGYFGAHDLDGDGKCEFVVEADFAKHVDVLGYRGGKLQLLWQRNIELDISNPQKILRVNPDVVADVDGDGKKEVLINLYNDTGDGRWHIQVCNGMTGEIKAEFPDEYLQGVCDIDGERRW